MPWTDPPRPEARCVVCMEVVSKCKCDHEDTGGNVKKPD